MWTTKLTAYTPPLLLHHAHHRCTSISNPSPQTHHIPSTQGVIRAQAVASGGGDADVKVELRTCRNCKGMYNPLDNHPRACRFHTAHFGGETKRKFESVHTGGTMDTVGGGEIMQYWHCCGVADAFDPGCEAAPHMSYDD